MSDDATTTKPTDEVLRTGKGQFAKGTAKPPGSGTRPGAKLRKLDLIIAEMEVKLCRNCDPVVTLLELAAGHDALAARTLEQFSDEQVQAVLDVPGWRSQTLDDLKRAGADPDVVRALKEVEVPRDVRVDAAKAATRFVRPILAQTEVSGPDKGAIPIATFPLSELMKSDEATRLIEEMQIALAGQVRRAQDAESERELADGIASAEDERGE